MGIGEGFEQARIGIILLGLFVILVTSMINQPVNAERSFYFEKVIDINKKSFQDSLINPNSLQKIFPENVKLVESKTDENEKIIAKMELGFAGFAINSEVELTNFPDSTHTMEIISGDLEGTKITTALMETWSYDGVPNEGTKVEIDMVLETSGYLSLIGLAPDDAILYSLDKSLVDIVSYVKSNNGDSYEDKDQNTSSDDTKETKINSKIKKRSFNR